MGAAASFWEVGVGMGLVTDGSCRQRRGGKDGTAGRRRGGENWPVCGIAHLECGWHD